MLLKSNRSPTIFSAGGCGVYINKFVRCSDALIGENVMMDLCGIVVVGAAFAAAGALEVAGIWGSLTAW